MLQLADYCDDMATLADRAWYAIHCLPRRDDGSTPDLKSIEQAARPKPLANATLSKVVRGERRKLEAETASSLAQVLRVDVDWLIRGVGTAPSLTGPLQPKPGTGGGEAWQPEVAERHVDIDDPYSTRAPVIAILRRRKADPAIVDALLAERFDSGDPGLQNDDYWWERVDHYRSKIERFVDGRADASALDHVPGKKARMR